MAWPALADCVSLPVKSIGKPDARNGHVRFDERGRETGRRFGVSTRARPRLYNRYGLKLGSLHAGFALMNFLYEQEAIGAVERCAVGVDRAAAA